MELFVFFLPPQTQPMKRRTSRSPARRSTPLRNSTALALRENLTHTHEDKQIALIRTIISLTLHLIILIAVISVYLRIYHATVARSDKNVTTTEAPTMNESLLIGLQQEITTLKQEIAELKQMYTPTTCNLPDVTGLAVSYIPTLHNKLTLL